jgi:alkanesulfonate monooxygenase SsuD/methylene tetrahydromethanopterin reductase-like flavin-dependent oxidoreductase (luciferase family)
MYVEALQVVRQLFATGQCTFNGEHYQIDISGDQALATYETAPPLIGSAGGPRSLREVTPLVDRVEVKASARATRAGQLDFGVMGSVTEEEVSGNIERVKALRPGVPIGIFILAGVGDDPAVQGLKHGLGNGYLARFYGEARDVATALKELGDMGIDRVQLTELVSGSHSKLAEELLG